jgi:aminoglycoside phosphotransferase (APT) family kinase protein
VTAAVLLDESSVLDHLQRRGVLGDGEPATAQRLGGGVSNTVIAVEAASRRVIVKQALPRLRVAREWLADPARTCTEGRALRVAGRFVPGAVPAVLDLDEPANVLVIEAAPPGTPDWKQRLLFGDVSDAEVETARHVGATLGRLHAATAADPTLRSQFDCWDAFEQLRVAPYFRSMVEDAPALAAVVLPHVEVMAQRRVCLVHGDVSPKNVLVGEGLLWLIDFEVACWGDPAFDVAFMLCHLALKAVHRPTRATTLQEAARAFVAAYRATAGEIVGDDAHVVGLLGCLLLARVDGRSPAEYLSPSEQPAVRGLGMDVAMAGDASLDAALDHAMAVSR